MVLIRQAARPVPNFSSMARSVGSQRLEREVAGIQVVAQVEHLGEAGAGPVLVVPATVAALGREQPVDAAAHGGRAARVVERAGGDQAEERPRGLRRRGLAAPLQARIVVGEERLAPTAVLVLTREQPVDAAPNAGAAQVLADVAQRGEREPGAVDVVGAPAPVPAALDLLFLPQERDGAANGRMGRRVTHADQRLDGARGDVDGGRVEHRVVVGERHQLENAAVAVLVERRPTAAPRLHREQPRQSAIERSATPALRLGVAERNAVEQRQHLGGVVAVGVELVGVLEVPAAGLGRRRSCASSRRDAAPRARAASGRRARAQDRAATRRTRAAS